jgi:hypothetical protein
MKSSLINITKELVQIKFFPLILDYLLPFDNKGDCNNCLNKFNVPNTALINFKISQYSDFLFFILDMSFMELCVNIAKIKETIKEELAFSDNDNTKYILSCIICIPYKGNLQFIFIKLRI